MCCLVARRYWDSEGYVNCQNNMFPMLIHRVSLPDGKAGVWCAMKGAASVEQLI